MIRIQRRWAQALQALGRRKFATVVVTSLLFYVFLIPKTYQVTFDGVVPAVEPNTVCSFLADFNNVKRLNPTIENFSITSDNGDYHRWEYGVSYTEHLSNIPFIKNTAHANYRIYHTHDPAEECVIESDHKTCFIGRFFCVDSQSKFICRQKGKSAYCLEQEERTSFYMYIQEQVQSTERASARVRPQRSRSPVTSRLSEKSTSGTRISAAASQMPACSEESGTEGKAQRSEES